MSIKTEVDSIIANNATEIREEREARLTVVESSIVGLKSIPSTPERAREIRDLSDEAKEIKSLLLTDDEKEEIIENSLEIIATADKDQLAKMKTDLFILKSSKTADRFTERDIIKAMETKIYNLEHKIKTAKNIQSNKDMNKRLSHEQKIMDIKALEKEIKSLFAYSDKKSKQLLLQAQAKLIILRSS